MRFPTRLGACLVGFLGLALIGCGGGGNPHLDRVGIDGTDGLVPSTFAFDEYVDYSVHGEHLEGRTVTADILRDDGSVLQTRSGQAYDSDWPDETTIASNGGPTPLSLRIRARCCGNQEVVSTPFRVVQASDPVSTAWTDANGTPLPNQVPANTEAWMQATFSPEMDGALVYFHLYMKHLLLDDHLGGRYALIQGGKARASWNIQCVHYNLCEYVFDVSMTGASKPVYSSSLFSAP